MYQCNQWIKQNKFTKQLDPLRYIIIQDIAESDFYIQPYYFPQVSNTKIITPHQIIQPKSNTSITLSHGQQSTTFIDSKVTYEEVSPLVLQMQVQQIIIHHAFKMKLILTDVETFPHGLDGLKIWQAGIVLARYAIVNCAVFKGKSVLQLGAGVGIAGLTIKKWTECQSIQMSDYHPQVVSTIKSNLLKNHQKVQTFVFDWRQRDTLLKTYDLIIGSDIVYFGCPVKDLYLVFEQKLKIGGKGIIVIPERKNYAQLFMNEVDKDVFNVQWEELKDEVYFESPLQNQEKAKFDYGLLWEIGFKALVITKKCNKVQV